MDKQLDGSIGNFVHRRLSQLKVLARLVEHELSAAKGSKDINLERDLVENLLDTVEIFIEDFEVAHTGVARERTAARASVDANKPAVTRLS